MPTKGKNRAYIIRKKMKFERKNKMKEHMGMPHFPDFEKTETSKTVEGISFSCSAGFLDFGEAKTTLGDEWEVTTRPDGTLTIKKKDAI